MEGKIKLNLGCGQVYKPGYINIDKFDNSVADKIYDAGDLPFKSNYVDLIEASQLIEHFDYIHCKYILSEWFRVLKPEGKLILETPDLETTFKKFVSSDLRAQKLTLQWIYGIDSLGMRHKTGFTFDLLKDLLQEIGFWKISREKPKMHRYEAGLRILCQKPKECLEKQLFAHFRKRVLNELKIDDSYILIPLEKWLKEVLGIYEKFKENKNAAINKIISKIALCNPKIPLIFLEECVKLDLLEKSEINDRVDLLNFLIKEEFHKKIFSLWIKRKKEIDKPEDGSEFLSELGTLISDLLEDRNRSNFKERLGYITNLESRDIVIFDFDLVFLEAKGLFNLGVKQFYKKDFIGGLDSFVESSKINPLNPLVYWNMARLSNILKFEQYKIIENYEKTMKLMRNRKNRLKIETELQQTRGGKKEILPKEPIPEDYQTV
jgi:predicted SAM-dependent methyltransferase